MTLTVIPLKQFKYSPPDNEIRILHQDDDILVVEKPAGLLSVPGKPESHRDCLEARLQLRFPDARIVHRLDMATSGVMVLAMNANAHRHLGLQFERRHIQKMYVAEVWGSPERDEGLIELPLRCDWPNRPLQMVDFELGKRAVTRWNVLDRKTESTIVCLLPETGRSHQLRVHMRELGHSILGDEFYAHEQARACRDRLMLHARRLGLRHPQDGRHCEFIVEAPFYPVPISTPAANTSVPPSTT